MSNFCQQLRHLTEQDRQRNWQILQADWTPDQVFESRPSANFWTQAVLNDRHHIAWPKGQQVLWLRQTLILPETLTGYPLQGLQAKLALTWWAEVAQVFLDGVLVQEGDLFDASTRLLLSEATQPGAVFEIAVRLVSPGHDPGALVSSLLQFESPQSDCPEPGFIAQEVQVLQRYLQSFAPEALTQIDNTLAQIDWSQVSDRAAFDGELLRLRDRLLPWSDWLKQRCIYLLGHAHLDLAWLWPVAETWKAAERTFRSVLTLQEQFPELIFGHSTPLLYAFMEQHDSDLFRAIKTQLEQGVWEVIAGLWVEPDLVLPSGESIARQLLYGQRYTQNHLGQQNRVAWLPDTFGFCGQLPQLLQQAGIDYFVTQKLTWNDTTEFPHRLFGWRAPNGSQVLSVMSAPIGTSIDPLKMVDYAVTWEQKTGLQQSLWLPGVGDHGGGPTRDMLETVRRWQRSPLFPRLEFTRLHDCLDQFRQIAITQAELPIHRADLYLELHRGCYTTHGDQKRFNRRSEALLYEAELFAALATLIDEVPYPKLELEEAWKRVLLNQFHDILPGSSITEVFKTANEDWQTVECIGEKILSESLAAIARRFQLPEPPHPDAKPVVVFNSLNWERSELVALPLPSDLEDWVVWDLEGRSWPVQQSEDGKSLLFWADQVPGVGYRLFWLGSDLKFSKSVESVEAVELDRENLTIENEFLRVTIDPQTGFLSSIFHRLLQREILSNLGNQLQAFQDQGQYWDAWNIDPKYQDQTLPGPELKEMKWLETGPLRVNFRVTWQLNQSTIQQDYQLKIHSPVLKILTQIDWQETHVLLKVAFPLTLETEVATYEMACGAIDRPTRPSTPAEAAQWEVPAHRWADLTTTDDPLPWGVSFLNDSKYGYDAQPHQLRLTLLRSPLWPDPVADRGTHTFSYGIYVHNGTWQQGETVHQGYSFNQPLQALLLPTPDHNPLALRTNLPAVATLLNLGANSLVLMAMKQAEDDPRSWIIRYYESQGQTSTLQLETLLNLQAKGSVNLLELPDCSNPELETISPWQIQSLSLFVDRF
jgi:alpha-mannosidase